jgi:hypothetical protein
MRLFGKKSKVAPAPPDAIEQKYIMAAIAQLRKEGKSFGEGEDEFVDGDEMMRLAKELQAADKPKTWKGGKTRRSRCRTKKSKRRARKTRRSRK